MIDLQTAPHIPGLKLRHFQGEADYAPLAAILTASEQADQQARQVTAAQLANAYQQLSNCDPATDLMVAEVAGTPVGYVRGWWREDAAGQVYEHNGFLLPAWRRQGLGTALLAWVERRLRAIAATHPPTPAKFFAGRASQFQAGTMALLTRAGYQPVRYFYEMVRPTLADLPTFPLPAGLEIRPVEPAHYRALWQAVDETSQAEWGYQKPTEADYQAWLTSPHFQPLLWQVAWESVANRVVGHVLTFVDQEENAQHQRQRGYTEGIGVDAAWRRRGLARALISRSLQAQKAVGMTESALAADGANPHEVTRLYESCGFQIAKCDMVYRKPM